MIVTRLSLFLFPLIATAFQRFKGKDSSTRGIKELEQGRSYLISLNTPDLLLWDWEQQYGEPLQSALVFNFTISHDQRHLLLQDQPILPLLDANIPPRFSVPQTSESLTEFEQRRVYKYTNAAHFEIDYERSVRPRDDPNREIHNYVPTLKFNVLGAGIAGHNTLLSSAEQRYIEIILKDENFRTHNPFNHKFVVKSVRTRRRGDEPNPSVLPEDLKVCGRFSWRCEDMDSQPWYRYIYRQDFDEFGKIGSLRREYLRRSSNLYNNLGPFRFWVLIVAILSAVVSPLVYSVCRKMVYVGRRYVAIRDAHRERVRMERECEGDMLLDDGDEVWNYIDRPRYGEGGEELSEKDSNLSKEATVMEKPLPPVPAAEGSEK
ncbi:hypothetical protein GLAREA_10846 [Glarea lozoyensis ATCC 20868]|uniref:Uncharacterized protein n=1 Tax=Glarea lozoyensis (strain ATCC 20868 / MF5171) TaxID=1116229 RepID=S3DBN8_GLAL2|nr:uncharacterized protein GLAREA_10846 [Glarea lozoyensis ATCC 20868]EPE35150.1 hypothetical protein GLAREA_10846 [Glarea lozoyensis ATCC 20868]